MKEIVIDTSVVIAVLMKEPERPRILELARDVLLTAPLSLHWEIGNAFSAMFKRRKVTLHQAHDALNIYKSIPLRLMGVSLNTALGVAREQGLYAYDAYVLTCAQERRSPLLTLDVRQRLAAYDMKLDVMEMAP